VEHLAQAVELFDRGRSIARLHDFMNASITLQ
jgi:hypothetical protein